MKNIVVRNLVDCAFKSYRAKHNMNCMIISHFLFIRGHPSNLLNETEIEYKEQNPLKTAVYM